MFIYSAVLLVHLQTMMKVPQVLATLLLLLQTATVSFCHDSIYFLAVTSQPVAGTMETLCIQVHPAGKTLKLLVTLEHVNQKTILLKHNGIKQHYYQCVPFKVPDVKVASEASTEVQISGGSTFQNSTKILIQPKTQLTIIQTDKPLYKPGQTVQFRVVSLDTNFLTKNQMFPTIELQDPNSNRIGQWLNQSTSFGILSLSYPIDALAQDGSYIINVWDKNNEQFSQTFDVKEYVLPKFEVIVQVPSVVTILDSKATLKVCANYTYGQPVQGSVTAVVCHNAYPNYWNVSAQGQNICITYAMTITKSGCASVVLKLQDFGLNLMQYESTISVDCEVQESGTGVVLNGSGSITVTNSMVSLTFVDTDSSFKLGMPYTGKINVTDANSNPIKFKPVYLIVRYGQNANVTLTLITNKNGIALFSLQTLLWGSTGVSLEASYTKNEVPYDYSANVLNPYYPTAYLWIQPFYSISNSFVEVKPSSIPFSCGKSAVVEAQYRIHSDGIKPGETLDFFYMVFSKGSLAQHGRLSVTMWMKSVNTGKLSFVLNNVNSLAPVAQVVVYAILLSGEVVADSQNFPVQLCLTNKVSLAFISPSGLPGSQTSVVLRAQPGSLCSVKAIDQSVLLLEPENELTVDSVFNLLPVQQLSGYPYSISDDPCFGGPRILEGNVVQPNLEFIRFPPVNSKLDVYGVFQFIGIKILTNADVKQLTVCRPFPIFFEAAGAAAPLAKASAPSQPSSTIRTYFPETWFWDLVPVGKTGAMGAKKTIPDTITTWSAEVFCTSPFGFGVAPKVEFTAFQPFFVSLNLPYSVIQGETFVLKASVFNYLSSCVMVQVTLAASQQFLVSQCDGCIYTLIVNSGDSQTFTWNIQPTALGPVNFTVTAVAVPSQSLCGNKPVTVPVQGHNDTVVQTLLVEAEGASQIETNNVLLCPTGAAVNQDVILTLPNVYVKGSVSASVSVLGDIIGQALSNLGNLLAMPYGCGEQNMMLFAPDIYILQYLESTGQLTAQITNTANTYLVTGYQRELTYKHDDGSYSAFGMSDPSGNTWLTAFVMKSFASAKQFIFVDDTYVTQAQAWLGNEQQSDGSFASVGQLIHTDLEGGVSDEVTLTAYVAAALLEIGTPTTNPVVQKSLQYLRNASTQVTSAYANALLCYTFTLAGDTNMSNIILNILDSQAIITADGKYWSWNTNLGVVGSLDIETTSYVLLAVLSGNLQQPFDLGYCASIVRWLVHQQNAFGGFASTQDTVVALQALTKYSAATFSPVGTVVVTVSTASGTDVTFTVDSNNRLLLQESSLSDAPNTYYVNAEGNGCVFVQFTLRYNIPPPADYSTFHISAKATSKCIRPSISVDLSITVGYNGERNQTNMVIIEVKLLSGFQLEQGSLMPTNSTSVVNQGTVKRVDQSDDTVTIYLDGLQNGLYETYSLVILQDVVVKNLQPAVLKVYDYYEPNEMAYTNYNYPCS